MSEPSASPEPKQDQGAAATPVFGSGTTFGTGSGFAGFTGAEIKPKTDDAGAVAGAEEEAAPEEECKAEFKPIVQLDEIETTTGEELEKTLSEFKCKLYRFDNDAGEWKERGVGVVKLLEHNENKRIRLLMRQDKTLKIRANHIIMPGTKLQEHSGSDKAWVWSTVDFAEEAQKMELFCMRFGSPERAQEFKKAFEVAMAANEKLLAEEEAAEGETSEVEAKAAAQAEAKKEAAEAADALADQVKEAVKVEDKE